ncbi:hypothetical protein HYC85_020582 [Camellia sinensis]|uniref:Protein kinase domain-containing protein n=1 Tax=Camellia sinensis TaxID=4442 RepID=A0A7J7GQH1_CAMSI|nr:hypothetical protein HYC85_020582 [Camellia sinensis]
MALESCEGGELFDQITRSQDSRHDSIKPENLLLTAEGHIKIANFGSVKPMQDSQITILPNASSDDKACTFVGTTAYVPPEVLNSSPATFGNDLWALGCTVYQMLSGTSPFKDANGFILQCIRPQMAPRKLSEYIIIILVKMIDDLMKLKRAVDEVIFTEFGEHIEYYYFYDFVLSYCI